MKRFTKFLYVLAGLVLMGYGFLSYDLLFWGRVPAWLTLQQIVYIALAGFILTVLIGFLLFAKGLLARRRLPAIVNERDGGIVSVSPKALRNITYVTIERFGGILEDRVRVRVLGGKQPCYYVKIWLGITEYSELPARHEEIRRRVGEALLTCTGVPARRVDLVFYTARTESAHMEGGDNQ